MENKILIGVGVLNWSRSERISDRYGLIHLNDVSGGYNDMAGTKVTTKCKLIKPDKLDGKHGTIKAVVLETRESGHIGDLFRGISPRTPEVGQEIELGTGTVFYGQTDGCPQGIGVKPDDGRASAWFNVRSLYDCHDQTVELWFAPSDKKIRLSHGH